MIDELINAALLGTDKKSLQLSKLPPAVSQALGQLKPRDEEEKLLFAAALTLGYRDAASLPEKYEGPPLKYDFTDSRQEAQPKYEQILSHLSNVDNNLKEALLTLWLEKLNFKNERVSSSAIVPLINLGRTSKKEIKSSIIKAIGQRGAAIFQKIDSFRNLEIDTIDNWSIATNPQRIAFLKNSPDTALPLIITDWDKENIAFKRNILDTISTSVNDNVLSFMYDKLTKEFQSNPKEKKTEKECRFIITKTLILHNHLGLRDKIIEKIRHYIRENKSGILGFAGLKGKTIDLPETSDQFWNADNLNELFALDTKNADPALYPRDPLYWFSQIASMIPIAIWSELLQKDIKACCEYFISDEKFLAKIEGKNISVFKSMLSEMAYNYPQQDFILWLFKKDMASEHHYTRLIDALDKKELCKFIKAEDLFLDHRYLPHWKINYGLWDYDFSKSMLNKIFKHIIKDNQYLLENSIIPVALFANASTLTYLDEQRKELPNNNWGEYWYSRIYKPLHSAINTRQLIYQY
jgi:hypothetical protein